MPLFFYDYWYVILVVPMIIFSLIMSANVKGTYSKYKTVRNRSGITGAEAARRILLENGITDVRIEVCGGELTDHYNPRTNVVSLSADVFNSTSVAAVGIAAHEVGHVCQHYSGYVPIKIRNAVLPVANIGSSLSIPLIILGIFLSFKPLVMAGVIAFAAVVLFQLVTLPVEFNASSRAMKSLVSCGILSSDETSGTRKVLSAAAMTYVAALAVSLAQLLRLILIARSNNRD